MQRRPHVIQQFFGLLMSPKPAAALETTGGEPPSFRDRLVLSVPLTTSIGTFAERQACFAFKFRLEACLEIQSLGCVIGHDFGQRVFRLSVASTSNDLVEKTARLCFRAFQQRTRNGLILLSR